MDNAEGFYKLDNGELYYAPNFVCSPDFELLKEKQASYTYPVHGWYWFNSEEEAKSYFGIVDDIPLA